MVAMLFVSEARSKMVSSVIGSAGAGEPSSPGSPASLRSPNAWRSTIRPPCPICTTAPGRRCAETASFTSWAIGANSGAGATDGVVVAGMSVWGATVSGAAVVDVVLVAAGGAGRPQDATAARASRTATTPQTRATRDLDMVRR